MNVSNADFSSLRGAKVFVTGAAGFIGSHLVEALLNADAQVTALYHYNSQNRLGNLDFVAEHKNLRFVPGDVRNPHQILHLTKGSELIFHLAALISIPYSIDAPSDYLETNVQGTLNILEAALINQVKRVVVASSSEVYGTPESLPITERHPLKAQSPYAATKVAADQLALSYYSSKNVPVMVLRPFNTYGPRQSLRAIIPTVISQLLKGSHVRVGNINPVRDLTYVLDTVRGFLMAALAPSVVGTVVQLGTGKGYRVDEIIEEIAKIIGKKASIEVDQKRVRLASYEVEQLISDPSLARSALQWEPQISFQEGLGNTIDHIKKFHDLYEDPHFVK